MLAVSLFAPGLVLNTPMATRPALSTTVQLTMQQKQNFDNDMTNWKPDAVPDADAMKGKALHAGNFESTVRVTAVRSWSR